MDQRQLIINPEEALELKQSGVPLISVPQFGFIRPKIGYLAGCHFQPCQQDYRHSGIRRYHLPPVLSKPKSPDDIQVIPVYDSQTQVPSLQDDGPAGPPTLGIVPLSEMMADLIRLFRLRSSFDGGRIPPAIMEIQGPKPTEQEFKILTKMGVDICTAYVIEADTAYHTNRHKDIREVHRLSLSWLGSEQRPWFEPIFSGPMKTSPITGKRIPLQALYDDGVNLLKAYQENGLNPLDYGDTFLAARLKEPVAAKKEGGPQR